MFNIEKHSFTCLSAIYSLWFVLASNRFIFFWNKRLFILLSDGQFLGFDKGETPTFYPATNSRNSFNIKGKKLSHSYQV